jgi:CBS domain-containing protein
MPDVGPQTVRELMLTTPKLLPEDVTVGEARAMLENPRVHMLLLGEGQRFHGAITRIPDGAPSDDPALRYADAEVETIGPDAPASVAYARSKASPYRRLVVLDGDGLLLGLLCLNRKHTGFCGGAPLRLDDRS